MVTGRGIYRSTVTVDSKKYHEPLLKIRNPPIQHLSVYPSVGWEHQRKVPYPLPNR